MNDDVIRGMRNRVEQCRRLAAMITHPEARETLLRMAAEGDEDIKRLEAEKARSQPPPVPN